LKKMILHVETRPTGPETVEEFNRWYDEVHVPEVLAIEGFVSARRYAPADGGDGPHVAQYEIEGDAQEAVTRLTTALAEGGMARSDTVRMDPPPKFWVMELIAEQKPVASS
jgi:hypothetical protein